MIARALLSSLLLLVAVPAQQSEPKPVVVKPAPQEPKAPDAGKQGAGKQDAKADAVLAEVQKQLQQEGITYDATAGTIAVKAVVNQPQDPIEYLLIHRKGKRHEAIFVTKAKPSVLNAALLMLGLKQGKNATYVEKNPPPTLEEVQKGADPLVVTPPQGEPFWMTVRWRVGEDGAPGAGGDKEKAKVVEHCVEDLLFDRTSGEPVVDCSWIYLGGRLAQLYRDEPEVYVADFEGNLVSVCYLTPDNHLGTMVHANARDDQNWWMTKLVPPPETEVEFVFHRAMPKLHQERLQRLKAKAAEQQPAVPGDKPADKQSEAKEPPKPAGAGTGGGGK
jgi:hypothetical protein